jgi:hypothetical protein
MIEAEAGLDRLTQLENQLTSVSVRSRQGRQLSAMIRVEADAYRKSLDVEQATATHDANPLAESVITATRRPTGRRVKTGVTVNVLSLACGHDDRRPLFVEPG